MTEKVKVLSSKMIERVKILNLKTVKKLQIEILDRDENLDRLKYGNCIKLINSKF